MSNDHKANTKISFANKAEDKKGAVSDKHEKLVQERLNKEVDATLNQAKILLDSEPKGILGKKNTENNSQHKFNFDNSKKTTFTGRTVSSNNQNQIKESSSVSKIVSDKKENKDFTETATNAAHQNKMQDLTSANEQNKKTDISEQKKKEEPLHMNDENKQLIVSAPEYDRQLPQQVSSLKSRVNLLTFALILVIGGAAYGAYYLDQQKYSNIQEIQQQVQQSSSNVNATEAKINELFSQIKAKDERVTNLLKANDELKNQNNILKTQQENLQKSIDKAAKQTEAVNIRLNDYEDRNPNDWLVAKSYFLVSNAQNILSFSDNIEGVLLNLSQADMLLVKIDEPAINQIREAISKDILSLKKIEHIDSKGILYKLDSVYDNIDNMPLNEFLTETQKKAAYNKTTETTDSIKDWKANILTSLKEFSSRFIEVRRRNDGVVNQYLSLEQSAILLQNIKTEILLAKIALFNKDQESFAHNLEEIKKHISAYYDLNNTDVTTNLEIIDEISKNNIALGKPDQLSCVPLFNTHAQSRFNLYKSQKQSDKPVKTKASSTARNAVNEALTESAETKKNINNKTDENNSKDSNKTENKEGI